MKPIEITVNEARGFDRQNYIIEQGIPVIELSQEEVQHLGIYDEAHRPVPANIQTEAINPQGNVSWLMVSIPVDVKANCSRMYFIDKFDGIAGNKLDVGFNENSIIVNNSFFSAEFTDPGSICISTDDGIVIGGNIGFSLLPDARSWVGQHVPVYYEPGEFVILEQSPKRVRIIHKGTYKAYEPKQRYISDKHRYDVIAEFIIYADSPAIRYRWSITDCIKFNCRYMWLHQYCIAFPLPEGSKISAGDSSADGDKFCKWASIDTPGGKLGIAFPHCEWFGKGAGIKVEEDKLLQGGINPPVDGGFGGHSPNIWRQFFYGMSRTFEGALIIGQDESAIKSEAHPIPLVLSPEYYSKTGALPEKGSHVTFGPWEKEIKQGAENLLRTQWKGTLWCGEWWREFDLDLNMGTQETNSGNSALGVLYHFYRTGDWRFWESAKMSYYYTYDIQFCKREDEAGPYMHTRRFLMDHREWFHPRYQRVGTLIKVGHLMCDTLLREKVIWLLKWWGDNYVAEDGSPMVPNPDGTKTKCTESAMSNFAESLVYAYYETGNSWFLDKARLIGDWVIKGITNDINSFVKNNNESRYIQRGLIALCEATNEQKYIDAFCKIAERTISLPDKVGFHLWFLTQAYKWSGNEKIIKGAKDLANWFLENMRSSENNLMVFPKSFRPNHTTRWACFYATKAFVSYLPVLASTLEEYGIGFDDMAD